MKKFLLLFVVLFGFLLIFVPSVPACDYGQVIRYRTSYVAPVVQKYDYSAFIAVPVVQYPVYGVGLGDAASEIRALRAELQDLRRSLRAPQQPTAPEAIPSPQPEDGRDRPAAFKDSAELLKVVQASCLKCHNPIKSEGGLSLVTRDGALADLPAGVRWAAHGLAASGEMPQGGPPVSDAAVKLFYDFARSGK